MKASGEACRLRGVSVPGAVYGPTPAAQMHRRRGLQGPSNRLDTYKSFKQWVAYSKYRTPLV